MAKAFKLEGKLEEVLQLIIQGETFTDIAIKYSCSIHAVVSFLNQREHQARAQEAVILSSFSFEEKSENAIKEITNDSSMAFVQRQRELALHYRWRAAKRNPNVFGDRIQVEKPPEQPLLPAEKLLQLAERLNNNAA